jgi:hypothetical protein
MLQSSRYAIAHSTLNNTNPRLFQKVRDLVFYQVSSSELGVSRFKLGCSSSEAGISRFKLGVCCSELGISHFKLGYSSSEAGISRFKLGVCCSELGISHFKLELASFVKANLSVFLVSRQSTVEVV